MRSQGRPDPDADAAFEQLKKFIDDNDGVLPMPKGAEFKVIHLERCSLCTESLCLCKGTKT